MFEQSRDAAVLMELVKVCGSHFGGECLETSADPSTTLGFLIGQLRRHKLEGMDFALTASIKDQGVAH